MWNLTSYDVNRIKGQLQARRARIDAKYAEETKALDADFADVETLERGLVSSRSNTSRRIRQSSQENTETADDGSARIENGASSEPQPVATSADGSSPDGKSGSRWRLALRDRPVASEAE
jgi:hypothetical protein